MPSNIRIRRLDERLQCGEFGPAVVVAIGSSAFEIGQGVHCSPCCKAMRCGEGVFLYRRFIFEETYHSQVCIVDAGVRLFVWVGTNAFDEDEGLAMLLAHGCFNFALSCARRTY